MNGSLFLSPANKADSCSPDTLLTVLHDLQIVGPQMDVESDHVYQAADGFARHVVFAGCSPYLRFQPESADDKQFCHLALHGPFEQPRIYTGENTVKPRCPACRARLSDWQERLNKPASPCAKCNEVIAAEAFDWRQHAAVGRVFIELRNVFPGEASPSDQLLGALKQASGFDWHYAWAGMRA